ncbi:MAG TPA: hypothetical protein VH165_07385 [Kofleriaceae bacterium]|jgi:hypothetical protein|nr:hypothetical protein [Kofleriaceae bacterium]
MTSRELIRWSRLHERRAHRLPALVVPAVVGGLLAAWVAWRSSAGLAAASHAWLAGAVVAYGVAFLRVPFHVYWRADAPLLAQLPIEGRPLLDAALVRCAGAAAATTLAVAIGLVPLALAPAGGAVDGAALIARHLAFAGALGVASALLVPAVTVGAAAMVVHGSAALHTATALAGAPAREVAARPVEGGQAPASPSAILGALPGFAATFVLAGAIAVAPWLVGGDAPAPAVLGAIAAVSVAAVIAARAGASVMAQVLRDVSALDRQRLATLEIQPPTAIERLIGGLIGAAALPYHKDARLMRRRFPMAFALGAMVFLVLVIVGLVRPDDPTPWLTVAIGAAASYGLVLAGRLRRPPIELERLSATLPLTATASARAKRAWMLGWWIVFAGAPGVFAAVRQAEPGRGLVLVAAATLLMIVAGALAH